MITRFCLAALSCLLPLTQIDTTAAQYPQFPKLVVCAIGDSHVTPRSALVRELQRELGSDYRVTGHGRRGWTTDRWIRAGDFAAECTGADIVLISLQGNDRARGIPWHTIEANIHTLIASLPPSVRTLWITRPSDVVPRLHLGRDGIHLTLRGAKEYAQILSPIIIGL